MEIRTNWPYQFLHLRHLSDDIFGGFELDFDVGGLLPKQEKAVTFQEAHGQILHLPAQSSRNYHSLPDAQYNHVVVVLRWKFGVEMGFLRFLPDFQPLLPRLRTLHLL